MKNKAIWVFFSIVSLLYFGLNWLLVSRGTLALEGSGYSSVFQWIYWILALSFVAGQVLERGKPTMIGRIITHIGSVWLAVFFYLLLFVAVVDLVRLMDSLFHFFPRDLFSSISIGNFLFIFGWITTLLITGLGYLNARYPRIHYQDVMINKKIEGGNQLKIALVTDLHIGAIIGKKRVSELIDQINKLAPNLVIFAGDVVDHNPLFAKMENIGPEFSRLNPSLGVFAVAGNHEFIGHAEVSINYLQEFGVQYIRDEIVNIQDKILIAGRDDRERKQHEGIARKPIEEILDGVNGNLPLILVDHQPVEYNQVENLGVDLMVSGHTHKGQLWPLGYITKLVFENDYGLMVKGKTSFYTSSGYGSWGPPIRTGNRPELVVLNVSGVE